MVIHKGGIVGASSGALFAATYFSEAKIKDLGLASLGDHDVRGFYVAVDDASSVGRVQGIGDFNCEPQQRIQIERTAGDLVGQESAVNILHDDEGATVLLTDVVDGADVRMIQRGCRLRLTLETAQSLRVSGNLLGQEFQSDETMEPGVFGLIDHTHAAAAQLFNDAVVRDGLPDHALPC